MIWSVLPWRVILPILAGLALLAGAAGYGNHHGAMRVQAKWDKAIAEAKAADDAARESDRLRARSAETTYETQRAAIARRAATPSPESVYALHATICPPAGPLGRAIELGDVPVPRVWLDRLRNAGADY